MTVPVHLSAIHRWNLLARAHRDIEHALAGALESTWNIGLTEFRALAAVAATAAAELRLQELQDVLGLNQSSVSRLVGRLEAQGLAYREVCDDDRRGVYCVITDLGRQRVAEATPTFDRALDKAMAGSPVDLRSLFA